MKSLLLLFFVSTISLTQAAFQILGPVGLHGNFGDGITFFNFYQGSTDTRTVSSVTAYYDSQYLRALKMQFTDSSSQTVGNTAGTSNTVMDLSSPARLTHLSGMWLDGYATKVYFNGTTNYGPFGCSSCTVPTMFDEFLLYPPNAVSEDQKYITRFFGNLYTDPNDGTTKFRSLGIFYAFS